MLSRVLAVISSSLGPPAWAGPFLALVVLGLGLWQARRLRSPWRTGVRVLVLLAILTVGLTVRPGRHPTPELAGGSATDPAPGDLPWWMHRFEQLARRVRENPQADVVFLGDSITQRFEHEGQNVWQRFAARFHPLNLGIGGDRTENLLWRLPRLELSALDPKAVVLLIGTNNCGRTSQPPDQIAAGIEAVVAWIRTEWPAAHVVLYAIFPRGAPDDPLRAKVAAVNGAIAHLASDPLVDLVDLGPAFLDAQGRIPLAWMPDRLHLSAAGYEIWARSLRAELEPILSTP
jgi:beta-glucosidase